MNFDTDINKCLDSFKPISLDAMDSVALMDRLDSKYVFNAQRLPELLDQLCTNYDVLEVNKLRSSNYESLYFDTKNFDLYKFHHNGKPNRFKIRFRKYASTSAIFFEIKLKNSLGRTIKKRIAQPAITENIHFFANDFLQQHTAYSASDFEAKMWVNFTRITMVSKNLTERVTLDFGLIYRTGDIIKSFHGLVIAEVKEEKHNRSAFSVLMKQHCIRQGTITKYCVGIASLFQHLKTNNFKPQLHTINKILNDTPPRNY